MNVYMLYRAGRFRPLFYTEDPEAGADDHAPEAPSTTAPPERGRLERTARRIKATIWRSGRRAGPRTRRLLTWLGGRPAPDESLLRGLRRADRVVLHHPALLSSREARYEWRHYLGRNHRHHLIASAWDWLLAILTAPLALLPGPNVVGLWFAYRAITHILVIRGIRRVQSKQTPTEFHAHDALNEPLSADRGEHASRVAEAFGLKNLSNFLRLSERLRRMAPEDEVLPHEAGRGGPAH